MSSTSQAPVGITFNQWSFPPGTSPQLKDFATFFGVDINALKPAVLETARRLNIPTNQGFKRTKEKLLRDNLVGELRLNPIFHGGDHKRLGDNSWMLHSEWQKNATEALKMLVVRVFGDTRRQNTKDDTPAASPSKRKRDRASSPEANNAEDYERTPRSFQKSSRSNSASSRAAYKSPNFGYMRQAFQPRPQAFSSVQYPFDMYKAILVDGEECFSLGDFRTPTGEQKGRDVEMFIGVDWEKFFSTISAEYPDLYDGRGRKIVKMIQLRNHVKAIYYNESLDFSTTAPSFPSTLGIPPLGSQREIQPRSGIADVFGHPLVDYAPGNRSPIEPLPETRFGLAPSSGADDDHDVQSQAGDVPTGSLHQTRDYDGENEDEGSAAGGDDTVVPNPLQFDDDDDDDSDGEFRPEKAADFNDDEDDDEDSDLEPLRVKAKRNKLSVLQPLPPVEASSTTASTTPVSTVKYIALPGSANLVVPTLASRASTPTKADIDRLVLDLSGCSYTKNEMMSYWPASASVIPTTGPSTIVDSAAGTPARPTANTEIEFEEYIAANSSESAPLNDQFSDPTFDLCCNYYKLDKASAQRADVHILVNGIKTPLMGIQYYGAFWVMLTAQRTKPNRVKVIGDMTGQGKSLTALLLIINRINNRVSVRSVQQAEKTIGGATTQSSTSGHLAVGASYLGLNTTGSTRCTHPLSTDRSPRCFCERRIKDSDGLVSYRLTTSKKASLIVVPATLFWNWAEEIVQHVDFDAKLNIVVHIARMGFGNPPRAKRRRAHDLFSQATNDTFKELQSSEDHSNKIFLGTPHFICKMSKAGFQDIFDLVVIDEYHDIGRHDSTLYKGLRVMAGGAMVVGLSGTPLDVGIARVVPLMSVNQAEVFDLTKGNYTKAPDAQDSLVEAFGEFALTKFHPKARVLETYASQVKSSLDPEDEQEGVAEVNTAPAHIERINAAKRDGMELGARWSAQNLVRRGEKTMWFELPATNMPIHEAYDIDVPYPTAYANELKALEQSVLSLEQKAIKKNRDKMRSRYQIENPTASTAAVKQYVDTNAKLPSRGRYMKWARLSRICTSWPILACLMSGSTTARNHFSQAEIDEAKKMNLSADMAHQLHQSLYPEDPDHFLNTPTNRQLLKASSTRWPFVRRWLTQLKARGEKALFFCATPMSAAILEMLIGDEDDIEENRVALMHSKMSPEERLKLVNQLDPAKAAAEGDDEIDYLIGTFPVMGKGFTAKVAHQVILFEPDWMLSSEKQGIGRSWRMRPHAQLSPVTFSYRLIMRTSEVEQKICYRQATRHGVEQGTYGTTTVTGIIEID